MHTAARILTTVLSIASPCTLPSVMAQTWEYRGLDRFALPDGGYRSQGVVSDGRHWFFSWRYGLEKTNPGYDVVERNGSLLRRRSGIPATIADRGGNHIGDIDQFDGTLYLPIEDAPNYRTPVIALFDAATLAYTGVAFPLQRADLTQGVPWVAVDGPGNLAYTAEWALATRLNVHRLSDFGNLGYLPLSQPVGRLQGAKVHGGFLYAASDNPAKSIYRIALADGSVVDMLQIGRFHDLQDGSEHELEGLAINDDAQGVSMHVLLRHGSLQQPVAAEMLLLHFARIVP